MLSVLFHALHVKNLVEGDIGPKEVLEDIIAVDLQCERTFLHRADQVCCRARVDVHAAHAAVGVDNHLVPCEHVCVFVWRGHSRSFRQHDDGDGGDEDKGCPHFEVLKVQTG